MESEFRPSSTRLLYALRRVHLDLEQRKQERLRQLDLLPSHYAVLINVWAHPGVTGAELARHLAVTPQNVASLVAKLSQRGLLERAPHPTHGHVLEVHLTDRGASLLQQADAEVAELELELVDHLGAKEAEHLSKVLDGILGRQAVDAR